MKHFILLINLYVRKFKAKNSNFWHPFAIICLIVLNIATLNAQTFSNSTVATTGSWNGTLTRTITVSGLPTNLGGGNAELIQFNIHMGGQSEPTRNFSRYNITLTSPAGTSITVVQSNPDIYGNPNANNAFPNSNVAEVKTKFRDSQYLVWPKTGSGGFAQPWHIGYYRTSLTNAFTGFNGENPNGTWTVTIQENSTSDGARFNKVEILFKEPFYINNLIGQSSNDDCSTPGCIGSDQINYASNSGYTPQSSDPLNGDGPLATNLPPECPTASNPNSAGYNMARNNSAWYYFIADSNNVKITLSGITAALQILGVNEICTATNYHVLNGGCPTDPINDDYPSPRYSNGSSDNMQLNLSNLTVGEKYYVVIDGTGGAISPFYIEVEGAVFCSNCVIAQNASFTICEGGSDTLSVAAYGGGHPYSYSWNPSNGLTATNIPNPIASPTSNTIYTVIITDTALCSDTALISVLINPSPIVTANASDDTVCSGQQIILYGSGTNTYSWSGGVYDSVSFVPGISATYTVTGTDTNGCSNTAAVNITINNTISITANASPSEICLGEETVLTVSGGTQYSWSGGITEGVAFTPLVTTTYSVTASDANLCSNTAEVTITVNPLPSISGTASPSSLCQGQQTILSGAGGTGYQWSGGVSNGVAFTPSASATYTVTGADNNSCSNTATVSITVNPLPSISGTASPSTLCQGQQTILSGAGGTSYQWSGGAINGVAFTPSASATYTVTGVDNNSCSNTATVSITVNNLPIIVILPANPSICVGESVNITVNGGNTYEWSPGSCLSSTNSSSVWASPSVTTVYTVTVYGVGGCSSTEQVNVIVNPNPEVTVISIEDETCELNNGIATLEGHNGTPGYFYQITGFPTQPSPVFSGLSEGSYTATVSDANGCIGNTLLNIGNHPSPSVTLQSIDASCGESNGSIHATVLGGSGTYQYTWNTNPIQTNLSAINLLSGTYTLTVSDGICETIVSAFVANLQVANASFYASDYQLDLFENNVIQFNNTSTGMAENVWNFGDGFSSDENHPQHFYSDTGTYKVTLFITDIYGCIDSASATIETKFGCELFIPNAFLPDRNGLNDLFGPVTICEFSKYHFFIYNRWGELLFSSTDMNSQWDGTYNGNPVQSGVYLWMMEYNIPGYKDKNHGLITGHVTLVR